MNKESGENVEIWKKAVREFVANAEPAVSLKLAREAARDYVYDLRKQGRISFSDPEEGELPSVHVVRRTLPEAWEDMNMAILGIGHEVHTHYDPGFETKDFKSFPSMEVTGILHIKEPQGEPRFHQHFLGGWLGFGDYHAEIEGAKDHWVLDPKIVVDLMKKGKFAEIKKHPSWLYSYSQRLRAYPYIDITAKLRTINQFNSVIKNLTKNPTSRSAQVTTWDPRLDHNDGQMKQLDKRGRASRKVKFDDYHAPCLQSLWFRLLPFEDGYKLNPNSRFRSHCHLKGLPGNVYGLVEGMVEPTRLQLQAALKAPVVLGRLLNISDSLHDYGHYLDPRMQGKDAEQYLIDPFRVVSGEPLEKRLVMPGTPMHKIMTEDIQEEYEKRKTNPDFDRS